jgi:hypothetical protein
MRNPMTELEREVFMRLLFEVWEAKMAPAMGMGMPDGDGEG